MSFHFTFSPLLAMFYIGSNVADWPYEAQRGIVDGHEICVREYPFDPTPVLPPLTILQTLGPTVTVCTHFSHFFFLFTSAQ